MTNTVSEDAYAIIEQVIMDDEGGWVLTDRKDDSGGATYGGMTWRTFNEKAEFPISLSNFCGAARLNEGWLKDGIVKCYYEHFWLDCHLDEVPAFAQQMFFSACVNMGKKEATKCLQMAHNHMLNTIHADLTLVVDGHFGDRTKGGLLHFNRYAKEAAENYEIPDLYDQFKLAFSDAVMERYIRIVQRNAREWRDYYESSLMTPRHRFSRVLQSENLMGWFNRARKYRNM